MEYALVFEGKVFTPSGMVKISLEEVEAYNKRLEEMELEHIKTAPLYLSLYVKDGNARDLVIITTFLGTVVGSGYCYPPYHTSFRGKCRKCHVRIGDSWYHGQQNLSQDLCNFRKVKGNSK